jgi:hypothetical protein
LPLAAKYEARTEAETKLKEKLYGRPEIHPRKLATVVNLETSKEEEEIKRESTSKLEFTSSKRESISKRDSCPSFEPLPAYEPPVVPIAPVDDKKNRLSIV